jgi:hypothetical protein
MATKELRELGHMYRHAYNSYMSFVDAVSEANEHGLWPSKEVLEREEQAMNELNYRRQCLLDALFSHSKERLRR